MYILIGGCNPVLPDFTVERTSFYAEFTRCGDLIPVVMPEGLGDGERFNLLKCERTFAPPISPDRFHT